MKLVEQTVSDFLSSVHSPSPTPGGGSVSALSGALAASLAHMAGELTTPKKAFALLDKDVQTSFHTACTQVSVLAEDLLKLVDRDTDAFNAIMSAFRLPKNTDTEKKHRQQVIQEATIVATEVPLQVAQKTNEVLDLLPLLVRYGNKNCLSDVGVAVLQAQSAMKGSLMNVKINLSGINDETIKKTYQEQLDTLWVQSQKAEELIVEIFNAL